MRYRLVYTRRAVRDIDALDPKTGARLGQALERLAEDPARGVERLSDSRLGTYRFRMGDYRMIFDLEGADIIVLRVGHRREIYRR